MASVNSPNMTGNCGRTYRRRRPRKDAGCRMGVVAGTPDLLSGPETVVMEVQTISAPKCIPTAPQYLVACQPGVHEQAAWESRSRHLKLNNSSPPLMQIASPRQNDISPAAPSKILSAGLTPRYGSGRQNDAPRTSAYFAGSKFGDAPPPTILPPPPPHWLSGVKSCQQSASRSKEEFCVGLTSGLKILLHVQ